MQTVVYHGSCFDGWCCAWLLHKLYPEATFWPAQYGSDPPDVLGRDVIIADFCYPPKVLDAMVDDAESIEVFDHHKTFAEAFDFPRGDGIDKCFWKKGDKCVLHYAKHQSGARMVHNHFFPDTTAPWLVDYTEDRDLWLWRLPDSRAINAVLRSHPMEFLTWDVLAELNPSELVAEGTAILRAQQIIIDSHVSHAVPTTIGGRAARIVNCVSLISETAGDLASPGVIGATFFVRRTEAGAEYVYSLRSDGSVDVADIAKKFSGGGHAAAAGFATDKLLWEN